MKCPVILLNNTGKKRIMVTMGWAAWRRKEGGSPISVFSMSWQWQIQNFSRGGGSLLANIIYYFILEFLYKGWILANILTLCSKNSQFFHLTQGHYPFFHFYVFIFIFLVEPLLVRHWLIIGGSIFFTKPHTRPRGYLRTGRTSN